MTENYAIITKDLTKYFGSIKAVDGISLSIQKGEVFSLLGPNGAGKSTTISMLCGLLLPTKGEAWILGHSITKQSMEIKASIGVVPQDIALYTDLSARENLIFWGKMYGLKGQYLKRRVEDILEITGLKEHQNMRIDKFSGGMKRRVNLGIALLHKPPIVIMDEPTVGIDPQSRRHILDNVKELNSEGMTVLYTTHYMEEAQELSHRIAIMDHGKIIACGTHEELVKIVGEKDRIIVTLSHHSEKLLESWRILPEISQILNENGKITLITENSNSTLPKLFESVIEKNIKITSVEVVSPNLESVFLHLTGHALRD